MMEIITAIALFMSSSSYEGPPIQRQDIQCMAKAIYHEARGEPVMGQIAVGWVIRNRVGHRWFEDSICGVVYQDSAFTDLERDLQIKDKKKYKQAVEYAIMVYTGYVYDPTDGAIMYHNPKLVPNPSWDFDKISYEVDIHNHRFYREKEHIS